MNFRFWKNETLPDEAKRVLSPAPGFLKSAKDRFLATFDARYHTSAASRPVALYKTAIVVVALFALLAGASAYADTNNVGVSNPLYPLKRLNESVRLALASPEEKPQIQADLAARREAEIGDLQARTPSSTEINQLKIDLRANVKNSIEEEKKTDPQGTRLSLFCGRLLSALQVSSSIANNQQAMDSMTLARIQRVCGQYE